MSVTPCLGPERLDPDPPMAELSRQRSVNLMHLIAAKSDVHRGHRPTDWVRILYGAALT